MLINTINSLINSPKTEQTTLQIASYVKEHFDEIPTMSIDSLAKGCFVSKAMISKFVKRLGYENFKEFKLSAQESVDSLAKKYPFYKFDEETLRNNAIKMMDDLTIGLRESIIQIDYEQIKQLLSDIEQADSIMMIGHGDAELICRKLQVSLDYLKKDVRVCDQKLEKLKSLGNNDLIIFISVNGYSFHYKPRVLRILNQYSQKKWLITCAKDITFSGNVITLPNIRPSLNDLLVEFLLKTIANGLNKEEDKEHDIE